MPMPLLRRGAAAPKRPSSTPYEWSSQSSTHYWRSRLPAFPEHALDLDLGRDGRRIDAHRREAAADPFADHAGGAVIARPGTEEIAEALVGVDTHRHAAGRGEERTRHRVLTEIRDFCR